VLSTVYCRRGEMWAWKRICSEQMFGCRFRVCMRRAGTLFYNVGTEMRDGPVRTGNSRVGMSSGRDARLTHTHEK